MKTLYIAVCLLFISVGITKSQAVIWTEGFETSDSANAPVGWSVWNNSPTDSLQPGWNWTVRPVGLNVPGLSTSLSVAHTGDKSIGVTWWTGQTSGICDAWLVTKKITNVPGDAYMSFWVTGGSNLYSDSVSAWVSTTDSMPSSFLSNPTGYVQNFFFPVGSTYGDFRQEFIDLTPYAGQDIYVGFRYNMDVAVNGYFVYIDDVEYAGTVGISQLGTNVPDKFTLSQNYPNPFNPTTNIKFDLAKKSNVKLTVFNSMGQVVMDLVNEEKSAGSYKVDFNASSLSSGTYFYRLETDYFTETKKMQLIK